MTTPTRKKFQNFDGLVFLIIEQNIDMITNGKDNSRLNPVVFKIGAQWHRYIDLSRLWPRNSGIGHGGNSHTGFERNSIKPCQRVKKYIWVM